MFKETFAVLFIWQELPNDDPSPAANVVITDIYQLVS